MDGPRTYVDAFFIVWPYIEIRAPRTYVCTSSIQYIGTYRNVCTMSPFDAILEKEKSKRTVISTGVSGLSRSSCCSPSIINFMTSNPKSLTKNEEPCILNCHTSPLIEICSLFHCLPRLKYSALHLKRPSLLLS